MKQELYGDIFFLINFAMDFIALYLTGKLTKTKLKPVRSCFAAALGGIYSVAALLIESAPPFNFIITLLVSLLICLVAGNGQGVTEILKFWVIFIVASGMIGGIMSALFSTISRFSDERISPGEDAAGKISLWLFALVTIISLILAYLTIRISSGSTPRGAIGIKVTEGGKSAEFDAICDSGNFLRDPISGRAAVIVSTDALKNVLPEEVIRAAERDIISEIARLPSVFARKIRLLPAGTVCGSGIIMGYTADRITIIKGKKEKDIEAILALVKSENIKKGYGGILPPHLT